MGDRLAFLDAEGAHDRVQPLAGEDAQQIVLAAHEELRAAGIALPPSPAAQLVVDPPALVPLGAEHEQAAGAERDLLLRLDLGGDLRLERRLVFRRRGDAEAGLLGAPLGHAHVEVAAELDVGAAAGHVGGDGHRAGHAGVGDDVGLLLVIAGVEHAVRQAGDRLAVAAPSGEP